METAATIGFANHVFIFVATISILRYLRSHDIHIAHFPKFTCAPAPHAFHCTPFWPATHREPSPFPHRELSLYVIIAAPVGRGCGCDKDITATAVGFTQNRAWILSPVRCGPSRVHTILVSCHVFVEAGVLICLRFVHVPVFDRVVVDVVKVIDEVVLIPNDVIPERCQMWVGRLMLYIPL